MDFQNAGWLNSLAGGLLLGMTNMANADTQMKQKKQELDIKTDADMKLNAQTQANELQRQMSIAKFQEKAKMEEQEKRDIDEYAGVAHIDNNKLVYDNPAGPHPKGGPAIWNKPKGASGIVSEKQGDPSIENDAWSIVEGRKTLKDVGGMGAAAISHRNLVSARADEIVRNGEIRPKSKTGVDGIDYVAQQGAANSKTNRVNRYTLARIESMNGVMDRLLKDSTDANQSQIPVLNRLQQYLLTEGGSTRFTDLKTTAAILGEEIANVIAGGQATPAETLKYQEKLFSAFQNPQQLPIAINSIRENMDLRRQAIEKSGDLKDYSTKPGGQSNAQQEWLKNYRGGK